MCWQIAQAQVWYGSWDYPPPLQSSPSCQAGSPPGGGGGIAPQICTIVSQCKSASGHSAPCKNFLRRLRIFYAFWAKCRTPPRGGGCKGGGGTVGARGGGCSRIKYTGRHPVFHFVTTTLWSLGRASPLWQDVVSRAEVGQAGAWGTTGTGTGGAALSRARLHLNTPSVTV